jgi:hypothetical protein
MHAAAYMVLPISRNGLRADNEVLVGLESSARAEIESRFSEMDLSQREIRQQLQGIMKQISSQVPVFPTCLYSCFHSGFGLCIFYFIIFYFIIFRHFFWHNDNYTGFPLGP